MINCLNCLISRHQLRQEREDGEYTRFRFRPRQRRVTAFILDPAAGPDLSQRGPFLRVKASTATPVIIENLTTPHKNVRRSRKS